MQVISGRQWASDAHHSSRSSSREEMSVSSTGADNLILAQVWTSRKKDATSVFSATLGALAV